LSTDIFFFFLLFGNLWHFMTDIKIERFLLTEVAICEKKSEVIR